MSGTEPHKTQDIHTVSAWSETRTRGTRSKPQGSDVKAHERCQFFREGAWEARPEALVLFRSVGRSFFLSDIRSL